MFFLMLQKCSSIIECILCTESKFSVCMEYPDSIVHNRAHCAGYSLSRVNEPEVIRDMMILINYYCGTAKD